MPDPQPLNRMRKAIVKAMSVSATIPQFAVEMELDVGALAAAREAIARERRPSYADALTASVARALRDVAYQANTLDFWRGCDAIGGPRAFALHGSLSDGKGEPSQSNSVSHGCPPARFRQVNILNTNALPVLLVLLARRGFFEA